MGLPPKLQIISWCCFSNCQALTNIRIPLSVEKIGMNAFSDSGLRSIEISENVNQIGEGACQNCLFLERVTFHSSTNLILANDIFDNCPLLSVITMYPWLWPKLFASMNDDDDDDNGDGDGDGGRSDDDTDGDGDEDEDEDEVEDDDDDDDDDDEEDDNDNDNDGNDN